jgi:hypothetical protein
LSLELNYLSAIAAGVAVGLIIGFIFMLRMFRSTMGDMLSSVVNEIDDNIISLSSVDNVDDEDEPINPYLIKSKAINPDKNSDYMINGSVQNYIDMTGYTHTELEDEK